MFTLISSQRRCSHSDSEKGSGPQTVKGPGSSNRNGPLGPGTALRLACPHCTGCRSQGPRGSMPKVHFLWCYLLSWGYSADPCSQTTSPERAWAGQRNGPQAHPCPLIQRRGAAAGSREHSRHAKPALTCSGHPWPIGHHGAMRGVQGSAPPPGVPSPALPLGKPPTGAC